METIPQAHRYSRRYRRSQQRNRLLHQLDSSALIEVRDDVEALIRTRTKVSSQAYQFMGAADIESAAEYAIAQLQEWAKKPNNLNLLRRSLERFWNYARHHARQRGWQRFRRQTAARSRDLGAAGVRQDHGNHGESHGYPTEALKVSLRAEAELLRDPGPSVEELAIPSEVIGVASQQLATMKAVNARAFVLGRGERLPWAEVADTLRLKTAEAAEERAGRVARTLKSRLPMEYRRRYRMVFKDGRPSVLA